MLSRVRSALITLLVVLAVAGSVAGLLVGPATGDRVVSDDPSEASLPQTRSVPDSIQQSQLQPIETRIEIQENGDARWRITMLAVPVETDAQKTSFENFASQYGSDTDSPTLSSFREARRQASTATGREMSITAVQWRHEVTNGTGRLVLSFTWTNFGQRTESSLRIDDVFNTTDGTWFPALGSEQLLVISLPDGYSLDSATPAGYQVSNGSLRWRGPRAFEPGDLTVTLNSVQNPSRTTTGNGTGGTDDESLPLFGIVLAVVGLGLVVALAYVFTSSEMSIPSPVSDTAESDDDSAPGDPVEADGASAGVTGDPQSDTEDDIDAELLSDEEQIERLLDRNGGRMKQANIVKETGWSNAKVSQLLSAMDENDRIDKLRIGRENLISFPDEDITDTNGDDS